jgi:hypothetical protein
MVFEIIYQANKRKKQEAIELQKKKEQMEKLKQFFKDNHVYLTLGLSALVAALIAYLGFNEGVQKTDKSKKEAEISALNTGVENTILKEKLADEKKSINEVSKDVDDLLDRK